MFFNTKKFGLGALLSIFVFVTIFGSAFFSLKPARAQMDANIKASFDSWVAKGIVEEVKVNTKEKAQFMFMSALMNGMNYFLNKIAYDMGVWMASGDWGQGPFASGKSFGNYMAQVAGDSLGEMLFSLGQDLGLDLCNLPDLRLDLALQLGFHFAYNEPKPGCTWQQLRAAYNPENVYSKYASREGLADRIGMGVQVKDTDFGIWLASKERIDSYTAEQSTGKQLDRQEGEGISALTSIISGEQKVPATVMKDELKAQAPAAQEEKRSGYTQTMVGAALQKGATAVALNAVSTFVNTLLGTVVTNFVEKGMFPGGATICNPGLSISGVGWDQCSDSDSSGELTANYYSSGSAGADNRRAAQEMFSELLAPKITTLENYDLASQMAECSEDNNSPDACVIDQSFMQILQQADLGDALTIKQAIERGLLHGEWKLISPGNVEETDKWTCAQEAYCYRNIQFLRQARILPVGFEMAAYISSATNPSTLADVVNNFYTESSIYYHLINPQWVIKMPKLRCASYAYGAVAQTGVRVQECVDLQHCVGYNKDGSCQSWGYCMKEKPIWKFDAEYCDSQYSTCRAFTSDDGDASYLTRTLDTTECNADNAGCARYSRFKYYVTSSTIDWYAQTSGFFSSYGTFVNSGINFDSSAPACDASNDGCSAFKLASDDATLLYLRKAPDYLGCYDADPSTDTNQLVLLNKKLATGIQWPQTISDLNLIHPQDEEACANYAQVCLPEEEYCNFYTASLTGEKIPAKFTPAEVDAGIVTWNEQCDAKCAGYAAYSEMPSNYSGGQNLTYVIPSSGKICAASESGCSAFSNLNATAGGMEQNEYFSYLRLCALPDQTKQRNYTVYESSEVGGYQIKTYTLVKDDAGDGPKQIYRDADEYAEMSGLCDAGTYASGDADPDCHQFIAEGGAIYYAFLSKTIVATDQCNPYRLNTTELIPLTPTDLRCPYDYDPNGADYHAGVSTVEFKNNTCYYMGFTGSTNGAGDTRTCASAVESCRAYKGNAGNNVRILVYDDFESGISLDWGSPSTVSITSSTESTQLGGHSLRVTASPIDSLNFNAHLSNVSVTAGKSYTLSFWMKGNMPLSRVSFNGTDHNVSFTDNTISASDVWRYYSFGPLNYDALATTTALTFTLGSTSGVSKQIFIDNIRLTEVTDYIYLVKNSLSVDPICDSNISDDLPGEALGCTAYSDPFKNMFYLTGFNYLCREAAVGCTAVLDTFNTPDDANPRAYNVWITGTSGKVTSTTLDGETFSCQVPNGETGCYTDIFGFTAAELSANPKINLTGSTIYIPPDTSTGTPIYLVANKDATCKAENMGCETLGKATPSVGSGLSYAGVDGSLFVHLETFEEVSVLNNPALYDDTLCRNEEAGCKTWASGDSTYYFKTPGATCEYKTETFTAITPPNPVNTIDLASILLGVHPNSTGWILKDTGFCLTASESPFYMGRTCATDNDCKVGTATGTCQFKGQVPCYPLNKKATGEYGLWSFGNTAKFSGLAGECPQEQSGCTEYLDHSSSGENYKCAMTGEICVNDSDCTTEGDTCEVNTKNAYYLLDNDKLKAQEAVCNGQVSQAEGCVLMDNTNNPNKYWNTASTSEKSQTNNDALVAPVDNGAANDANTIVKVKHDRECAEWAYCDFKQTYVDPDTDAATSRCYHLGVCQQANVAVGAQGQCAEVVTGDWAGKGVILTVDYYKALRSTWDSIDLSGYSLPFMYQVPDLRVRLIDDTNRLVYVSSSIPCADEIPNGTPCGTDGACYAGECLFHYVAQGNSVTTSRSMSCRGYPEEASPFSTSILSDDVIWNEEGASGKHLVTAVYKTGFEDANLCYNASGQITSNCDCSYDKFKTSGGDIFTNAGRSTETGFVCTGGEYNGKDCDNKDDVVSCGENGTCSSINTVAVMDGWQGYCMEGDLRQNVNGTNYHRCLTWWPLELAPGSTNIWATDPSAGYEVGETDNRFMCLRNAAANRRRTNDNPYFDMGANSMQQDWGGYDSGLPGPNGESVVFTDAYNYTVVYNSLENSIVTGCWNTNTSAFDDVWGLAMGGGDTDSQGKYCPMNVNTLNEAGQSIFSRITLPAGQTYLQKNDIERIDVYLDKRRMLSTSNYSCSDGWVSFYNNILDEEPASMSFIVQENFSRWGCEGTDTNSDWGEETFTGDPNYPQLGGWYAWQWIGGGGFGAESNWRKTSNLENDNILINIKNDHYASIHMNNETGSATGIRVMFDGDHNFRGIWMDGEDQATGDT
ncbi:MAG: hypothetical protein M0Q92_14140, partial [Methanoregula sp.]|nr:hypothetical protein [Methanoregula sp.]